LLLEHASGTCASGKKLAMGGEGGRSRRKRRGRKGGAVADCGRRREKRVLLRRLALIGCDLNAASRRGSVHLKKNEKDAKHRD